MPDNSRFQFIESPDSVVIDAVAASRPYSPFAGRRYVAAIRATGLRPLAFFEEPTGNDSVGCMGFLNGGHGYAKLTIPSMPNFAAGGDFWTALRRFSDANGIADIEANSFASLEPSMPEPGRDVTVTERYEHVLTLVDAGLDVMLSNNHKRNLNKAKERGLELRQSIEEEALDCHCELAIGSLQRQAAKGPGTSTSINRSLLRALLRSGCASVWQAWHGATCHSSVFLLTNQNTAYYYSAGNSSAGLESRASVWLVTSIARQLFEDGLKTFNLGGTSPGESGLRRFKSGFGAREVPLLSARLKLKTGVNRVFSKARARVMKTINPDDTER
jgi:hypothetical protein